jgi:DNA-binding transcriptional ArsR family regulator
MVKYSETQINSIFQSLADPTRRDILTRITRRELNVSRIAKNYKMSLPAISKHLRVLENAELVIKRQEGRDRIYTVNPRALLEIQRYIEFYTKFWDIRFNKIENMLKQKGVKKNAK